MSLGVVEVYSESAITAVELGIRSGLDEVGCKCICPADSSQFQYGPGLVHEI